MWIDAHCHLADPRLEPELDAVIARSRAAGVTSWIQGGTDPADWQKQLELRARFGDGVVPCFGLHPWWVHAHQEPATVRAALEIFEKRLDDARGFGELGLDKAPRLRDSLEIQKTAFREQLRIIQAHGRTAVPKPLILHAVRAHGLILEELDQAGSFPAGGLVHQFTGAYDVAKQYLDRGFVLSISGSISRDGFKALKEALPKLPAGRWVIETDSPDQPLKAGALNEPGQLPGIAAVLAELLGADRDELLRRSTETLKKLFHI